VHASVDHAWQAGAIPGSRADAIGFMYLGTLVSSEVANAGATHRRRWGPAEGGGSESRGTATNARRQKGLCQVLTILWQATRQ